MLFLAFVIGVSLPSFSWTQDVSVTIDGKKYEPDCTVQRLPLSGTNCRTKCVAEEICAIRGIPYANASRFGRAQALNAKMREELEWKNEAVHCAQIDPLTGEKIVTENCLVVDLYFPKDWKNDEGNKRHLIVLMEGVDFESSLAGYLSYDIISDTVLEKHMMAVVHYRTGPFGFMTLRNQLMPANLGLWDQQMALKFLKDQTSALKVNDKFIVLGFGSGAVALHVHMLNPVSKALFKKVLLSGGNALSPGAVQSDALNTTLTLAKRLKCDDSSMEAVAKCLRKTPAEDLLTQARVEPALRFATSVDANESDTKLENVFISAPLDELVRQQKINDMEVVIHGYPALAGLSQFARNKDKTSKDDDVSYVAKFFDMYSKKTAKVIAGTVLDQFSGTSGVKKAIEENPMGFIELLTDFAVANPIQGLVSRQVQQNPSDQTTTNVKLDSFIVLDFRKTITEGEVIPTLASVLTQTKGSKVEPKFGYTLDDMLLFVGCKGVAMHSKETMVAPKVVSGNAEMIADIVTCLLDSAACGGALEYSQEQGTYISQRAPKGKDATGTDPYHFQSISRWSSGLALASGMDRLEAENWALELEKQKNAGASTAGAGFWGMLVAVIVLAVLSILLIGILVKMVMDKRRGGSLPPIEKPARSGAHYNAGMETVTVEEGNRM